MYADDTNVFISGQNIRELEKIKNRELVSLTEWLMANRLSLNVQKTHFIIFSPPRKKPNYKIRLHIDNDEIHSVQHTKFLGVIIDANITWKPHTKYIKSKLSKSIGIIGKARKYLNLDSLKRLYFAFVYPYFVYSIVVWGGTYNNLTGAFDEHSKMGGQNSMWETPQNIFCASFKDI